MSSFLELQPEIKPGRVIINIGRINHALKISSCPLCRLFASIILISSTRSDSARNFIFSFGILICSSNPWPFRVSSTIHTQKKTIFGIVEADDYDWEDLSAVLGSKLALRPEHTIEEVFPYSAFGLVISGGYIFPTNLEDTSQEICAISLKSDHTDYDIIKTR